MPDGTDVLMITYNRPAYTRLALARLLDTCDGQTRVWIWQNGSNEATISVAKEMAKHPAVHRFVHSEENVKLRTPTNWLFKEAKGSLIGKIDDDCIMPYGWHQRLREFHTSVEQAGALGSWPFRDEDIRHDCVERKTVQFAGYRIMVNPWVGGAGYLMKRACIERCGPLRDNEGFTSYCMRVARAGWINGWPLPLIIMDHMDDPRSEHTVFCTDADVIRYRGLTAERRAIETLAQFRARVEEAALEVQTCSADWRDYIGWRARLRRVLRKGRA